MIKEFSKTIKLFLKDFKLKKLGEDVFWNSYHKTEEWLNESTHVSILERTIDNHTQILYKKLFENQNRLDYKWKKHIATKLLEELKIEWKKEDLTLGFIINELEITEITFGFEKIGDFSVYYRPKTINCEHGVILLGDKDGNPLRSLIA